MGGAGRLSASAAAVAIVLACYAVPCTSLDDSLRAELEALNAKGQAPPKERMLEFLNFLQIPTTAVSVRPLGENILRHISASGKGLDYPTDVVYTGMEVEAPLLKFDTHKAVDDAAFRESVMLRERTLLAYTPGREELLEIVTGNEPKLTSRSDRYNIFYWDEPWVGDYYWTIKRAFEHYIEHYNIVIDKPLYIHGWANCFREGIISWHKHMSSFAGTFSAVVPEVEKTSTIYRPTAGATYHGFVANATKEINNINSVHDMVLFDGFLEHRSTPLSKRQLLELNRTGAECRITSSWDLSDDIDGLRHSVPFYDPQDPDWTGANPGDAMIEKVSAAVREKNEQVLRGDKMMPSLTYFTGEGDEFGERDEKKVAWPLRPQKSDTSSSESAVPNFRVKTRKWDSNDNARSGDFLRSVRSFVDSSSTGTRSSGRKIGETERTTTTTNTPSSAPSDGLPKGNGDLLRSVHAFIKAHRPAAVATDDPSKQRSPEAKEEVEGKAPPPRDNDAKPIETQGAAASVLQMGEL